jgi:hypothetical protein
MIAGGSREFDGSAFEGVPASREFELRACIDHAQQDA